MPYERLDYYNVIAASMRRKFQVPVATGDDLEEKLKKNDRIRNCINIKLL